MKCPNCGKHVKAGAKFCLHCGYPLQKNNANGSKGAAKPMPKKRHRISKKVVWSIVGVVVVILLVIGGLWCKRYFTPARAFSRRLPKSTWVESNQSRMHKKVEKKKGKKGKTKKVVKHVKGRKKTHYSYIISNGKQLLSFGKNKKSTRIFNALSSSSNQGTQLRSNLSKNMKNSIIQSHYTYQIKGNGLYFKNGTSYRDIKKSKGGYTFKCYKGKKFLHTETVKKYKSLKSPIK